jgi:hypothetical protein
MASFRAARDSSQIRSLVRCVDLVGSRRIWPAHVGSLVDLIGSSRVPSDRLDDQASRPPEPSVQRARVCHWSRPVD